ncbi:unnamed protein product [Cylicocyclus nassatus]|uniref:Uncharacterized protein n=1 Tax=Cylicocyclus nassatus TaxID=53992 RepID=A0AA36M2X4_CYLNA|nr:unnamed protein product [Cylicocyclus nassatus]
MATFETDYDGYGAQKEDDLTMSLEQKSVGFIKAECSKKMKYVKQGAEPILVDEFKLCTENAPTKTSNWRLVAQKYICPALEKLHRFFATYGCTMEPIVSQYMQHPSAIPKELCTLSWRSNHPNENETNEEKVERSFMSGRDFILSTLQSCDSVAFYACGLQLVENDRKSTTGVDVLCIFSEKFLQFSAHLFF